MFQSTEKQYKNSQMFGYMNYLPASQYPNTNIVTLKELGKLNGLTPETMKYRDELFGIIGNNQKYKQDNMEILNQTYYNYFVAPIGNVEPIAPELYAIGGVGNTINKVVGGIADKGFTIAQKSGGKIGAFAEKYPNIVGSISDGTVALLAHTSYKTSTGQEINPYEALGAFSGGILTRNKSLGNQIRINVGITTVTSLSKDPRGNDLGNAYWGAVTSPISGYIFNKSPVAGKELGAMASEYFGDLEAFEKTYKYLNNKVDEMIKKEEERK